MKTLREVFGILFLIAFVICFLLVITGSFGCGKIGGQDETIVNSPAEKTSEYSNLVPIIFQLESGDASFKVYDIDGNELGSGPGVSFLEVQDYVVKIEEGELYTVGILINGSMRIMITTESEDDPEGPVVPMAKIKGE